MKKGNKMLHWKQTLPTLDIKCTSLELGVKPTVKQWDLYHSQTKQIMYVPSPHVQREAQLSFGYGDLNTTDKLCVQIGSERSNSDKSYSPEIGTAYSSEGVDDPGKHDNGAGMFHICGISLDKTKKKLQLHDFEQSLGYYASVKPAKIAKARVFGQFNRKEAYIESLDYTMPYPGTKIDLSHLDKYGKKLDNLHIAGPSLTLPHLPLTPTVSKVTQTMQGSEELPHSGRVGQRAGLTSSLYQPFTHPRPMQLTVVEKKPIETFKPDHLSDNMDSFQRRRYYGKNLEKNWLRQMRDEKRQQKQADRLEAWMTKHMKPHTIDLDTAFYSSDSDLDSDREETLSNVEHNDVGSQDSTYIRLASTDVVLSDTDFSDSSVIETYLQDGQIRERYVKGKERRRRLRHERKYTVLIDDQGISDDELEYQKGEMMSDAEIRTMRLKLEKKKKKEMTSIISNDSLADLKIEIANFLAYSRKVNNKKHRKRKSSKTKITIENAKIDLAREARELRIRFLTEYGFLLTATDLAKLYDRPDELDKKGAKKRKSVMAKTVMEITSDIDWNNVYLPSKRAQFTEEDNKYLYKQSHLLANRRNTCDGNISLSLKSFEKTESKPMNKTITKKQSCLKKSVHDAGLVLKATTQSEEYIDEAQPECPEDLEPAEIIRQLGPLKRPLSCRMFRDNIDKRITLRELTEGIDFPAKEIKLQIVERRLRKQRQKALACQHKHDLGCEPKESIEDDDVEPTYDSEGEDV